jgi:hypothetical protein
LRVGRYDRIGPTERRGADLNRAAALEEGAACDRWSVDSRVRVIGRRIVVVAVVLVQVMLVGRAYSAAHKEFGFQMFSEASEWRADIVRVTTKGERIPIETPWAGYSWNALAGTRGLSNPGVRHHADAGVDNQLAFLENALDYIAVNTPRDGETAYLEAIVTYWRNGRDPETVVFRSEPRAEAS